MHITEQTAESIYVDGTCIFDQSLNCWGGEKLLPDAPFRVGVRKPRPSQRNLARAVPAPQRVQHPSRGWAEPKDQASGWVPDSVSLAPAPRWTPAVTAPLWPRLLIFSGWTRRDGPALLLHLSLLLL